jgi:hypothetical protein
LQNSPIATKDHKDLKENTPFSKPSAFSETQRQMNICGQKHWGQKMGQGDSQDRDSGQANEENEEKIHCMGLSTH